MAPLRRGDRNGVISECGRIGLANPEARRPGVVASPLLRRRMLCVRLGDRRGEADLSRRGDAARGEVARRFDARPFPQFAPRANPRGEARGDFDRAGEARRALLPAWRRGDAKPGGVGSSILMRRAEPPRLRSLCVRPPHMRPRPVEGGTGDVRRMPLTLPDIVALGTVPAVVAVSTGDDQHELPAVCLQARGTRGACVLQFYSLTTLESTTVSPSVNRPRPQCRNALAWNIVVVNSCSGRHPIIHLRPDFLGS